MNRSVVLRHILFLTRCVSFASHMRLESRMHFSVFSFYKCVIYCGDICEQVSSIGTYFILNKVRVCCVTHASWKPYLVVLLCVCDLLWGYL